MAKDIEWVCTANIDRGPFAEIFMKRKLKEKGIEGIGVYSSGTMVSDMPLGLRRMVERQKPYRDQMIIERGLSELLYHEQKQTIIRPEAELIFALSRGNFERVNEIYSKAVEKPDIRMLECVIPLFRSFESYKKMVEQIEALVSNMTDEYFKSLGSQRAL